MKDKKYADELYAPRNYVNAWLTDTLKSRIYGKTRGSDAKAVRIQWDANKNTVQADIVNTSSGEGAELFSVAAASIDEARFEGNTFSLTLHDKRYRFIIANDQFTKEGSSWGPSDASATHGMSVVADILLDPAVDDLKILRRLLEAQNVKIVGVRIVRSILVGLGVAFIILAILYFIALAYVNSQAK